MFPAPGVSVLLPRAPRCFPALPRAAGSLRSQQDEKEKQSREVVCSKLYAEIIGVWMSGLGLRAAVGDWATFPGGGKSRVSVAADPALAAVVSAGLGKHCP